jgi:outer membrane scaffolding protein for murein synthesis (MipA/OmpV family)
MFGANVTRLGGASADSPIVERRQALLLYLGFGINL